MNPARILVALILFCLTGTSFAKRAAPAPVAPVTHGHLEYRAVNTPDCPGCVEIWDVARHAEVDAIEVYRTPQVPGLEQDVQWVFVTKLELHGNRLLVTNERGEKYQVDLKTKAVKRLAGG